MSARVHDEGEEVEEIENTNSDPAYRLDPGEHCMREANGNQFARCAELPPIFAPVALM